MGSRFFTGNIQFGEDEEYFAFRYRFTMLLLFFGCVLSALYVVMDWAGVNELHPFYWLSTAVHSGVSGGLFLVLRGHKQRFPVVSWTYAVVCFLEFMVAMAFATNDEFRLIWFVINLAGVYIILGRPAGVVVTVISLWYVGIVNRSLEQPFSDYAMVTFYCSLIYNSIFFYVYSGRSLSFYLRLVDANARLKQMAERDPLTGLLNARAYYGLCDSLIRAALRSGAPVTVLFVDLDHFKSINDRFGHEAGDTVLKAVAACLTRTVRQSDLVGRIGGEEFSVYLPDTALAGALALAEKLRQEIEALMPVIAVGPIRITASLGVAPHRPGHQAVADIQREADQAMYQAKARGRNRVTSFAEVCGVAR